MRAALPWRVFAAVFGRQCFFVQQVLVLLVRFVQDTAGRAACNTVESAAAALMTAVWVPQTIYFGRGRLSGVSVSLRATLCGPKWLDMRHFNPEPHRKHHVRLVRLEPERLRTWFFIDVHRFS